MHFLFNCLSFRTTLSCQPILLGKVSPVRSADCPSEANKEQKEKTIGLVSAGVALIESNSLLTIEQLAP